MDCGGYKSDGGANVGFIIVDKVLDSKSNFLQSTISHSPIKNSVSNFTSDKCDAVLTNGTSEVLADDESIQKNSIISEFSLDKQNELPNINIVIDSRQSESDPDSNTTLDQSNVEESNERIVETESLDEKNASDEVKQQLNTTQFSVLEGLVTEEERSSNGDGISKEVFKGELGSEKQKEGPSDGEYCSNVCIEDNCTPVPVCVEERNLKSDSINNENVQKASCEPGKVVEVNQHLTESNSIHKLLDATFPISENDECVSEEEVYLEVDDCVESDEDVENVDKCPDDNGVLYKSDSENEFENIVIDSIIRKLENETPENVKPTGNSDVLNLPLKIVQCSASEQCDELISEEVYDEVKDFSNKDGTDGDSGFEKQDKCLGEINNDIKVSENRVSCESIEQCDVSKSTEIISTEQEHCPIGKVPVPEDKLISAIEKCEVLSEKLKEPLKNELVEDKTVTEGNCLKVDASFNNDENAMEIQSESELLIVEKLKEPLENELVEDKTVTEGNCLKVDDSFNNDENVMEIQSESELIVEKLKEPLENELVEDKTVTKENCLKADGSFDNDENTMEIQPESALLIVEKLKESLENELIEDKTVTEENCLKANDSFDSDENAMEIHSESELLIVDDDEESEDDIDDKVLGVATKVSAPESFSDKCQADEVKNLDLKADEVKNLDQNADEVKNLDQNADEVKNLDQNADEVKNLDQNADEVKNLDQNADEMPCSETRKDTKTTESPKNSSELDDFDLDDAIEEFAKVESNVVKLSDDELDSLVEEFVEAECSNSNVKAKVPDPQTVLSESDDELELLIEDFKAVNSDDDCFIVEDTSNEIVINVDCNEKDNVKSNPSRIESRNKHKPSVGNGDVILSLGQSLNVNRSLDVLTDEVKCVKSSSLDGNITSNLIATEHATKIQVNCSKSAILNTESVNINETNTNFEVSSKDLNKIKNDQTHKNNHHLHTNVSSTATIETSNSIVSSFKSGSQTNKPSSSSSSDLLSKEIIKEACNLTGTDQNLNSSKSPGSEIDTELFLKGPVGNTYKNCSSAVVDVLNNLVNSVHSNISVNFNTELKNICNSGVNSDSVVMKRTSCQFQDASLNVSINACDKLESKVRSLPVDAKTHFKSEEAESGDRDDMEEIIIDCQGFPEKKIPESITSSNLIKPLNSVCENLEIQEESKKRKLDELDKNSSDATAKKLKEDENFETPVDSKISLNEAVVGSKVKEKVRELIPEKTSYKLVTKKKCLDKIVTHVVTQTIQDLYGGEIDQQRETIKELEEKIQALDEDMLLFQTQASELVSAQQKTFQQHGFNPQVQVRTVGVNVKIFRECDLQNVNLVPVSAQNRVQVVPRVVPQSMNKPALSVPASTNKSVFSVPVNKPVSSIAVNKPVSSIPVNKPVSAIPVSKPSAIPANKPQPMPPQQMKSNPIVKDSRPTAPTHVVMSNNTVVKRLPTPRIIINPTRPRQITTSQRVFSVSPKVAVGANTIATVVTNPNQSRSLVPRLGLIPPRAQTTTNSGQVIDLTNEESSAANKRTLVPTTMVTVPPTVSKVNLPRLPNNQNVLVPLSNFNNLFQMLPSSTQSNSQLSVSNPIQVSRQTLVSSLPQGLGGQKTVAYLMPANNAHVATIGGRGGIPVPPFLTGSNQGVRTLFVHVTNPGAAPTLSSIVNSSSRMHAPVQSLLNTNTASTSSTGLVLFPRAVKHPAPFPHTPAYPINLKLKALPPKPSLKGSKASHGIILSWNMSLHSVHAEISNYQLFAYQETSGVVNSSLWKKVGDVKALPLPMACTLTQFIDGNRYYFSVRAVDAYTRFGPFSDPVSIMYAQDNSQTSNK